MLWIRTWSLSHEFNVSPARPDAAEFWNWTWLLPDKFLADEPEPRKFDILWHQKQHSHRINILYITNVYSTVSVKKILWFRAESFLHISGLYSFIRTMFGPGGFAKDPEQDLLNLIEADVNLTSAVVPSSNLNPWNPGEPEHFDEQWRADI